MPLKRNNNKFSTFPDASRQAADVSWNTHNRRAQQAGGSQQQQQHVNEHNIAPSFFNPNLQPPDESDRARMGEEKFQIASQKYQELMTMHGIQPGAHAQQSLEQNLQDRMMSEQMKLFATSYANHSNTSQQNQQVEQTPVVTLNNNNNNKKKNKVSAPRTRDRKSVSPPPQSHNTPPLNNTQAFSQRHPEKYLHLQESYKRQQLMKAEEQRRMEQARHPVHQQHPAPRQQPLPQQQPVHQQQPVPQQKPLPQQQRVYTQQQVGYKPQQTVYPQQQMGYPPQQYATPPQAAMAAQLQMQQQQQQGPNSALRHQMEYTSNRAGNFLNYGQSSPLNATPVQSAQQQEMLQQSRIYTPMALDTPYQQEQLSTPSTVTPTLAPRGQARIAPAHSVQPKESATQRSVVQPNIGQQQQMTTPVQASSRQNDTRVRTSPPLRGEAPPFQPRGQTPQQQVTPMQQQHRQPQVGSVGASGRKQNIPQATRPTSRREVPENPAGIATPSPAVAGIQGIVNQIKDIYQRENVRFASGGPPAAPLDEESDIAAQQAMLAQTKRRKISQQQPPTPVPAQQSRSDLDDLDISTLTDEQIQRLNAPPQRLMPATPGTAQIPSNYLGRIEHQQRWDAAGATADGQLALNPRAVPLKEKPELFAFKPAAMEVHRPPQGTPARNTMTQTPQRGIEPPQQTPGNATISPMNDQDILNLHRVMRKMGEEAGSPFDKIKSVAEAIESGKFVGRGNPQEARARMAADLATNPNLGEMLARQYPMTAGRQIIPQPTQPRQTQMSPLVKQAATVRHRQQQQQYSTPQQVVSQQVVSQQVVSQQIVPQQAPQQVAQQVPQQVPQQGGSQGQSDTAPPKRGRGRPRGSTKNLAADDPSKVKKQKKPAAPRKGAKAKKQAVESAAQELDSAVPVSAPNIDSITPLRAEPGTPAPRVVHDLTIDLTSPSLMPMQQSNLSPVQSLTPSGPMLPNTPQTFAQSSAPTQRAIPATPQLAPSPVIYSPDMNNTKPLGTSTPMGVQIDDNYDDFFNFDGFVSPGTYINPAQLSAPTQQIAQAPYSQLASHASGFPNILDGDGFDFDDTPMADDSNIARQQTLNRLLSQPMNTAQQIQTGEDFNLVPSSHRAAQQLAPTQLGVAASSHAGQPVMHGMPVNITPQRLQMVQPSYEDSIGGNESPIVPPVASQSTPMQQTTAPTSAPGSRSHASPSIVKPLNLPQKPPAKPGSTLHLPDRPASQPVVSQQQKSTSQPNAPRRLLLPDRTLAQQIQQQEKSGSQPNAPRRLLLPDRTAAQQQQQQRMAPPPQLPQQQIPGKPSAASPHHMENSGSRQQMARAQALQRSSSKPQATSEGPVPNVPGAVPLSTQQTAPTQQSVADPHRTAGQFAPTQQVVAAVPPIAQQHSAMAPPSLAHRSSTKPQAPTGRIPNVPSASQPLPLQHFAPTQQSVADPHRTAQHIAPTQQIVGAVSPTAQRSVAAPPSTARKPAPTQQTTAAPPAPETNDQIPKGIKRARGFNPNDPTNIIIKRLCKRAVNRERTPKPERPVYYKYTLQGKALINYHHEEDRKRQAMVKAAHKKRDRKKRRVIMKQWRDQKVIQDAFEWPGNWDQWL